MIKTKKRWNKRTNKKKNMKGFTKRKQKQRQTKRILKYQRKKIGGMHEEEQDNTDTTPVSPTKMPRTKTPDEIPISQRRLLEQDSPTASRSNLTLFQESPNISSPNVGFVNLRSVGRSPPIAGRSDISSLLESRSPLIAGQTPPTSSLSQSKIDSPNTSADQQNQFLYGTPPPQKAVISGVGSIDWGTSEGAPSPVIKKMMEYLENRVKERRSAGKYVSPSLSRVAQSKPQAKPLSPPLSGAAQSKSPEKSPSISSSRATDVGTDDGLDEVETDESYHEGDSLIGNETQDSIDAHEAREEPFLTKEYTDIRANYIVGIIEDFFKHNNIHMKFQYYESNITVFLYFTEELNADTCFLELTVSIIPIPKRESFFRDFLHERVEHFKSEFTRDESFHKFMLYTNKVQCIVNGFSFAHITELYVIAQSYLQANTLIGGKDDMTIKNQQGAVVNYNSLLGYAAKSSELITKSSESTGSKDEDGGDDHSDTAREKNIGVREEIEKVTYVPVLFLYQSERLDEKLRKIQAKIYDISDFTDDAIQNIKQFRLRQLDTRRRSLQEETTGLSWFFAPEENFDPSRRLISARVSDVFDFKFPLDSSVSDDERPSLVTSLNISGFSLDFDDY